MKTDFNLKIGLKLITLLVLIQGSFSTFHIADKTVKDVQVGDGNQGNPDDNWITSATISNHRVIVVYKGTSGNGFLALYNNKDIVGTPVDLGTKIINADISIFDDNSIILAFTNQDTNGCHFLKITHSPVFVPPTPLSIKQILSSNCYKVSAAVANSNVLFTVTKDSGASNYDIELYTSDGDTNASPKAILNQEQADKADFPIMTSFYEEGTTTEYAVAVWLGEGLTANVYSTNVPISYQIVDSAGNNLAVGNAPLDNNVYIEGTSGTTTVRRKPIVRPIHIKDSSSADLLSGFAVAWTQEKQGSASSPTNESSIWFVVYRFSEQGGKKMIEKVCMTIVGDGPLVDFNVQANKAFFISHQGAMSDLTGEGQSIGYEIEITPGTFGNNNGSCDLERKTNDLIGENVKSKGAGSIAIHGTNPIVLSTFLLRSSDNKIIHDEYFIHEDPATCSSDPNCVGCYGGLTCGTCKGSSPEQRFVRYNSTDDGATFTCTCQDEGYYDKTGSQDCGKCKHQCRTCSDDENCDSCQNEDMFLNSICLFPKAGHYEILVDGVYQHRECSPKCQECDGPADNCRAGEPCAGKNRDMDNNCDCIAGHYDFGGQLKDCPKCHSDCNGCIDGYTCLDCSDEVKAKNRELNPMTGTCDCKFGYILESPDSDTCVEGWMISDGFIDKCPQNTSPNQQTKICEYKDYSLASNVVLIIIFGVLIALIQIVLCLYVHRSVQKKYQEYADSFHEDQMKLKQQRQFIYKGLEYYDGDSQNKANTYEPNDLSSIQKDSQMNQSQNRSEQGQTEGNNQAGGRRRRRQIDNSIQHSRNNLLKSDADQSQSNLNISQGNQSQIMGKDGFTDNI